MSVIATMSGIEQYIQSKRVLGIPVLFNRYKVLVQFYRTVNSTDAQMTIPAAASPATLDSVYNSVYGPYGNSAPATDPVTQAPNQASFSEFILFPQYNWTPADTTFAGDFSDHYIISPEVTAVRPEDRFFITRDDGVVKGWKVDEIDVIGMTLTTYKRWKISAILDSLGTS